MEQCLHLRQDHFFPQSYQIIIYSSSNHLRIRARTSKTFVRYKINKSNHLFTGFTGSNKEIIIIKKHYTRCLLSTRDAFEGFETEVYRSVNYSS
jgi:hypothetical protein